MLLRLLLPVMGIIIGDVLLNFSYTKRGNKNQMMFFVTVLILVISQGFLIGALNVVKGGFIIKDCVCFAVGALAVGAIVLWGSRLLFDFDREAFRVLLGVSAICAGWLGGTGFDLFIAFKKGVTMTDSALAIYMMGIGAVLIALSDLTLIFKNFSLKKRPYLGIVYGITNYMGVALILAGTMLV